MMDVVTLLLPILWAIVSTVIGLILYKSSQALFEHTTQGQTGRRRIRLVGSVTIAALAFYAMKSATPNQRLQGFPTGAMIVNSQELKTIHDLSIKLDRVSLEIQGCSASLDSGHCADKIKEARDQASAINDITTRLLKGISDQVGK